MLGYELDVLSSVPGRDSDGNFSLRHRVQTGSGAHLASYPVGFGCYFPGGKATEA